MAVRAPAFPPLRWHNSTSLSLENLKGKTLLLDFFTYGCINCLNNLSALKALKARYGEELVVIGVHSAKFERERDDTALAEALKRLGIMYPVVNDAEHTLFDAYAAKAWPTMVLVDANGYEAGRWSGEGHFDEVVEMLDTRGITPKTSEGETPAPAPEKLHFPTKLLVADGLLAVANTGANTVLLFDFEGKMLNVIDALDEPVGMAVEGDNLYVAERGNGRILRIDLQSGARQTLLENLRAPCDVLVTKSEIIVALAAGHRIVIYDKATLKEKTVIGNGSEALRDGFFAECQLAQPSGLAYDGYRLWFVDAESSSLRYVENGEVKTVVGEGLFSFGDSCAGELLLQHPEALDIGIIGDGCGGGRLFIADTYNNKIKVFSPDDGAMFEILSGLHAPAGIAKKGCSLYIADTNAHRIVRFDLQQMQAHSFL